MKPLLIKQIKFEHWANTQVLSCLKNAISLEEKTLLLFSHILSVSNIWLSRLQDQTITSQLFQVRTISECEVLLESNTKNWLK